MHRAFGGLLAQSHLGTRVARSAGEQEAIRHVTADTPLPGTQERGDDVVL